MIKPPHRTHAFTHDQVEEFRKCIADPIYFMRRFMRKYKHLRHDQLRVAEYYRDNRFVLVAKPRQAGITTLDIAQILHTILFKENQSVAILSPRHSMSVMIMDDLRKAYLELPEWMQQNVKIWNQTNIAFENGSRVIASTCDGQALRGNHFDLVVIDEFAWVDNRAAEDFMMNIFPVFASGETTKFFMVSTPKEGSVFDEMWDHHYPGFARVSMFYQPIDMDEVIEICARELDACIEVDRLPFCAEMVQIAKADVSLCRREIRQPHFASVEKFPQEKQLPMEFLVPDLW